MYNTKAKTSDNVFDRAVRVQNIYNPTASLRLTLLVRETLTPDQHEILFLNHGSACIYNSE